MMRTRGLFGTLLAATLVIVQSACAPSKQPGYTLSKPPDLVVATQDQLQVQTWDSAAKRYALRCSTHLGNITSLTTADSLIYAANEYNVFLLTADLKVIKTWTYPGLRMEASALCMHEGVLYVRTAKHLVALTRTLDSLGSVLVGSAERTADVAFIGDTAFVLCSMGDDGVVLVDTRDPRRLRLLGWIWSGEEMSTAPTTCRRFWFNPDMDEGGVVSVGHGCIGGGRWQHVWYFALPHDSVAWPVTPSRRQMPGQRFWGANVREFLLPYREVQRSIANLATRDSDGPRWNVYGTTQYPPLWMVTRWGNDTAFYIALVKTDKGGLELTSITPLGFNALSNEYDDVGLEPTARLLLRGQYLLVQTPSADGYFGPSRLAVFDVRGAPRQLALGGLGLETVRAYAVF